MQENYITLDPANVESEDKFVRKSLHSQRLLEAQGGKAASILGMQAGISGAVLTYSYLEGGQFKMFPFTMAKSMRYGQIAAAYVGCFMIGHSFVMGNFGDSRQYRYLTFNRGGIVKGSKSWDREEA